MTITIPPFPVIPMQESQHFTDLMTTNMPQIGNLWGATVRAACKAYGTDPNLIFGFIGVENPDLVADATSSAGAYGVMQLQPVTAWNYFSKQLSQMPPDYANVISKKLPGLLLPGGFSGLWSKWHARFTQALLDPEFNIWTGVTGISQLIWADIKANNGALRMDHVIVKYNAGGDEFMGAYHKYVVAPGLKNASPQDLVTNSNLPSETKAYLIKYLGIEGSTVIAIRSFGTAG